MCADRATLAHVSDDLVIEAYTLPLRCRDWQPMIVFYSNGACEWIQTDRDVELLETATANAKRLELAVPPDDVAGHARRLLGL